MNGNPDDDPLGHVRHLWRYPVKSMQGEQCDALELRLSGVAGDRRYALFDAEGRIGSGKNSGCLRKIDGLLELSVSCGDSVPEISFPDGTAMRADDRDIDAALSRALGQPVTLAKQGDGAYVDAAPVHILTTASLAWLRAALPQAAIDERRFRPNLLLDVHGVRPIEQTWLGRRLRIGTGVTLDIRDPTERCAMVALAQRELPGDPAILRRIAESAELLFGVYAEVLVPGRVRRDDPVVLL